MPCLWPILVLTFLSHFTRIFPMVGVKKGGAPWGGPTFFRGGASSHRGGSPFCESSLFFSPNLGGPSFFCALFFLRGPFLVFVRMWGNKFFSGGSLNPRRSGVVFFKRRRCCWSAVYIGLAFWERISPEGGAAVFLYTPRLLGVFLSRRASLVCCLIEKTTCLVALSAPPLLRTSSRPVGWCS